MRTDEHSQSELTRECGACGGSGYTVQVWFATSAGYRTVRVTTTQAEAEREGRAYTSDSRGVRVVTPDLRVLQIKEEAQA